MEGILSWALVPDLSHVQQQLKMIKCFLLDNKQAILHFLKDQALFP